MANEALKRDLRKRLESVRDKYGFHGLIIQVARSRPEVSHILIEPRYSPLGVRGREEVLAQIFSEPTIRNRTGKEPAIV